MFPEMVVVRRSAYHYCDDYLLFALVFPSGVKSMRDDSSKRVFPTFGGRKISGAHNANIIMPFVSFLATWEGPRTVEP